MAFIPVDETARCAITFEDNAGNTAVNVIHIMCDGFSITPTVLSDMADVVEAWLEAEWDTIAPTSWRAANLELLDLTLENSYYHTRDIDIPGLDAVDALPSTVTIAISLRSVFSGRSRRGRLYHVGMSDSRVTGDYITEAAETAYINAYEQLRSALLADNFKWVVVSYVADGVPRAEGLRTEVTSIVITDRLVDKQSRRKPRPG